MQNFVITTFWLDVLWLKNQSGVLNMIACAEFGYCTFFKSIYHSVVFSAFLFKIVDKRNFNNVHFFPNLLNLNCSIRRYAFSQCDSLTVIHHHYLTSWKKFWYHNYKKRCLPYYVWPLFHITILLLFIAATSA